ncbi:MAG: SMP-30/gluconolactonase/LRE family protein [Chloroflexota bacterium]
MTDEMILSLDQFAPFANGLDHPEGVVWGPDGFLYAGGEAGQIYQVNPESGEWTEFANTGGFILGLAFDGGGNLYACDNGNDCVQKISPSGAVTIYSSGNTERAMAVPNYPVFDQHGNLYVTDSGGHHERNGCLWRVSPGGLAEVVSTAVNQFPNGLALSANGDWLYIVLSNMPGVVRITLNADGTVGEPETVIEMPQTVPDGLAFDTSGNLYISCYTPDRIYRLTPAGELAVLVDDWESTLIATPTNIAFGGSDLKTLFIASLGRWHLTKGTMPVTGMQLNYPVIE